MKETYIMGEHIEKPNLLRLRQSKGWTQQQAADTVGISRSYYGMMETSDRMPSIKVAHKLAHVFNFSWNIFFEEDEPE